MWHRGIVRGLTWHNRLLVNSVFLMSLPLQTQLLLCLVSTESSHVAFGRDAVCMSEFFGSVIGMDAAISNTDTECGSIRSGINKKR